MKSKVFPERIALIEFASSHDECLLTQIHALKSRNCWVLLVTNEVVRERNASLESLVDEWIHIDHRPENKRKGITGAAIGDALIIRRLMRTLKRKQIDKVVFNTAQGGHVRNACLFSLFRKMEFIGVIHTIRKFQGSFTQRVIHLKIKKYFVLGEFLRDSVASDAMVISAPLNHRGEKKRTLVSDSFNHCGERKRTLVSDSLNHRGEKKRTLVSDLFNHRGEKKRTLVSDLFNHRGERKRTLVSDSLNHRGERKRTLVSDSLNHRGEKNRTLVSDSFNHRGEKKRTLVSDSFNHPGEINRTLAAAERSRSHRNIQISSFYPIDFPKSNEEIEVEAGHSIIALIGSVETRRKDLEGFISLIKQSDVDVHFHFLGKADPNSVEVIQLKKALEEINCLSRVTFYDSFLNFDTVDLILRKTHAILPLVHPNTPSAEEYFRHQVPGAMNIALGYQIPLLMHAAYRHIEELNPASLYYQMDTFTDVLEELNRRENEIRQAMKSYPLYSSEYQYERYLSLIF